MRQLLSWSACWLLASRLSAAGQAQPASEPTYRTIVRLDALYPVAQAIALQNMTSRTAIGFAFPIPLVLGGERQLRGRFSGGAELLINTGDNGYRESGINVQGRYYFGRYQRASTLLGGYLAPVMTGRLRQERALSDYGYRETHRSMVGCGLLVGWQLPCGKRWVIDTAGGMLFGIKQISYKSEFTSFPSTGLPPTYTDYGYPLLPIDGRLSLGYRF